MSFFSTPLRLNSFPKYLKHPNQLSNLAEALRSAGFDEDDSISDRNQIVGLRGDFGTVMLGRYDTFLKDSQGAIDQFKDYTADLKYLFEGEVRADNSLTYYSPAYKGFKLGFTYVF